MITTTSLNELFKIVNVEHEEPHHILGMHEIEKAGKKIVAVRAFIPQAKKITVVDAEDAEKTYKMLKIHEDGFFEVIIENRYKWFRYKLKIEDFQALKNS